jgi:hypothetical protein
MSCSTQFDLTFTMSVGQSDSTCLSWGTDKIQGADNDLGQGWVFVDQSNGVDGDGQFAISGAGSTSGSFVIAPSTWGLYGQLAIGLEIGSTWAAFELPSNTESGEWSVPLKPLSHAILYGYAPAEENAQPPIDVLFGPDPWLIGTGPDPFPIPPAAAPQGAPAAPADPVPNPEPASLVLSGLGLGLASLLLRRGRK